MPLGSFSQYRRIANRSRFSSLVSAFLESLTLATQLLCFFSSVRNRFLHSIHVLRDILADGICKQKSVLVFLLRQTRNFRLFRFGFTHKYMRIASGLATVPTQSRMKSASGRVVGEGKQRMRRGQEEQYDCLPSSTDPRTARARPNNSFQHCFRSHFSMIFSGMDLITSCRVVVARSRHIGL